jgi:hypothetical protein
MDLVYPALNNVLLVLTGLGTAGLGLVLGFGLGTVGLCLDLGLGRPGLDNITAETRARRSASTEHGSSAAYSLYNDQHLLQCHEMTRSGQISAADHITLALQLHSCKTSDSSVLESRLEKARRPHACSIRRVFELERFRDYYDAQQFAASTTTAAYFWRKLLTFDRN